MLQESSPQAHTTSRSSHHPPPRHPAGRSLLWGTPIKSRLRWPSFMRCTRNEICWTWTCTRLGVVLRTRSPSGLQHLTLPYGSGIVYTRAPLATKRRFGTGRHCLMQRPFLWARSYRRDLLEAGIWTPLDTRRPRNRKTRLRCNAGTRARPQSLQGSRDFCAWFEPPAGSGLVGSA